MQGVLRLQMGIWSGTHSLGAYSLGGATRTIQKDFKIICTCNMCVQISSLKPIHT